MGDTNVEQIKERTDIVALIGEHVRLKKAGTNFTGLCPFHNEKTPSFVVSPIRQMFHCFGCGKSGDIFTWVMEKEGMTFAEALRVLAQRAGVILAFDRPQEREQKEKYRATLDIATDFYNAVLQKTNLGREAKEYLLSRGISEQSIQDWRLGFVPANGTPLIRKAAIRGVSAEDLFQSGILAKNSRGYYERFYGRVLFPLIDIHGSVIALAGRILKENKDRPGAKYINSQETTLYRKSKFLYGLNKAREAIREKDSVIIVEGYTDVIGSHQIGVSNVVATSGTALTQEHLSILKRFTNNITFAFDGDSAGDEATKRALGLAVAEGFAVYVIVLPDEVDPAEMAIFSPNEWQKLIDNQVEAFPFLLGRSIKRNDIKSTMGKKKVADEVLPVLARVSDPLLLGEYMRKISFSLNISPQILEEDLKTFRLRMASSSEGYLSREVTKEAGSGKDTRYLKEERLLAIILSNPILLPKVAVKMSPEALLASHTKSLYNTLLQWYNRSHTKGEPFDLYEAFKSFSEDLKKQVEVLLLRLEVEQEEGMIVEPYQEMNSLLKELLRDYYRQQIQILTNKLEESPLEEHPILLQEITKMTENLVQAENISIN